MKEKSYNETSLTILGLKLFNLYFGIGFRQTEGTPVSVIFDPEFALKHKKYLIGFYHVHPNMAAYPSNTDISTMFTWCDVLGKRIYCMIEGNGYFGNVRGETVVENYMFETDPYSLNNNVFGWCGEAMKIGRFFFWKV